MKRRPLSVSAIATISALFGLAQASGCGDTNDDSPLATNAAALAACHLDDGTVGHDAKVRACDPQDTHKTTICHIPPGNPANQHTLCIGNAAVPAHLGNHGDYLGACRHETPCDPPSGSGGSHGGGGGSCGQPGGSGGAGTGGAGTGGASGGTGGAVIDPGPIVID